MTDINKLLQRDYSMSIAGKQDLAHSFFFDHVKST